jgi:hypothetical protein
MGFFSKECNECSKSIRSAYATTTDTAWMAQAVAVDTDDRITAGEYDGYGNIGSSDDGSSLYGATVWHRQCWEEAGRPRVFDGDSAWAADQGYFIDDDEDDE